MNIDFVIRKRNELSYTQKELSLECGFYHDKIQKFEQGKIRLSKYEEEKILSVLMQDHLVSDLECGCVKVSDCAKCKRKTVSDYMFTGEVRSVICNKRFIGFIKDNGKFEGNNNRKVRCDFGGNIRNSK